jgi:DNA-binding transcriptional ArsR family regulator
MQGVKLESSLLEQIAFEYQSGCKAKEIAKRYNISYATVNNIRLAKGLSTQLTRLDTNLIQELKTLFESGISLTEISRLKKMSRNTVTKALRKAGITAAAVKIAATKRQTIVKVNPFEDISNPQVQYYLGLLATDGCIHEESGSISLGLKDKELIRSFSKFVGYSQIYEYKDKRFKDCTMYSLKFVNWEAVKQLKLLGLTARKTFTLNVNFPLSFAFLRGVIDGDGCVMKTKNGTLDVSISTASVAFVRQIEAFLSAYNIVSTINASKVFKLRISARSVLKLRSLLYNNSKDLYLERKKEIFYST